MSKEYFEIFGVLLGIYGIFRACISWHQSFWPSESENFETHSIDTSGLAERLAEVRQDYAAKAQAHQTVSTKPFRIAERREKITKLAFFQKPPAPNPESPEHDQRLLFLAL